MPITDVEIVSSCAECGTEIGRASVKKDNMMLFTKEQGWCSNCQADRPQVRDVTGRLKSIDEAQHRDPKDVAAEPFPGQADGR